MTTKNNKTGKNWATYIRRSTDQQSDEHQEDDILDWLDYKDIPIETVDIYSDTGSGASHSREDFTNLTEEIKNGKYDVVVVWEISRIARKGIIAQKFFDACENNGVTIKVTNGAVREIGDDGTGRMVADIIASVSAEERRRLIERTKSGRRRARKDGKYTTRPPKGFTTTNQDSESGSGYLVPILNPDYDEGETGFFDIADALEQVENGKSYRKAAQDTPNCTRQTLSSLHSEKKNWYLEGQPDDERVIKATENIQTETN